MSFIFPPSPVTHLFNTPKGTTSLYFLLRQKHGNPSLHSISYTHSTKTQPHQQPLCYFIPSQIQTILALFTYCSIIQSGQWARGSNYPTRSGTRWDHSSQGTWVWAVYPTWLQARGMLDLPSLALEWLSWSEWWSALWWCGGARLCTFMCSFIHARIVTLELFLRMNCFLCN